MIATRELESLLPRVDTLPAYEAKRLTQALQAEILAQCAQDGLFWLKFVQTRDEADPEQSVKGFPVHLEYVQRLWAVLAEHKSVVIAKSRQMLVSWLVACFCVHIARFKPNQAIYWQTKQWDDAVAMVCMPQGGYAGRCQFIEENLPAWMKLDIRCSEGRIQYPNGSIIQALAGGADKVRSKVVSVYVGDEFAHQEDQQGVFTSVGPLIQKGARAIFVSTPNGSDNTFATLFHGRPVGQESVA